MYDLNIIPRSEFRRIETADISFVNKLSLIADMCRANTLTSVKIAGSGHLGSSFSSLDIVAYLYYQVMNTARLGTAHDDRDIFFSSKGHDVPGLYSVLYSLGIIPRGKLLKLRRIDGLDGHPDVSTQGIECNSGSLGMGISKAKGLLAGKRLARRGGRVIVMTGDGELQEGQIYEALQSACHQKLNDLIVIVDHNKVQSDKEVRHVCDLRDLEEKVSGFGWYVKRCNGHDFQALEQTMNDFGGVEDRPKLLIADTIKGKGISFMEHPKALKDAGGVYLWHSGAPDDESFFLGYREIIGRINRHLTELDLSEALLDPIKMPKVSKSGVSSEYVAESFGQAIVEIARVHQEVLVLDADLAADCRIREFEKTFPDRFFENGIAEQDMVSMAGGLALQGFLPVVNSFAAFLASRANEQIYTNVCEKTKIIYVCHYAGLIPAGPGKSHQSLRDISLLAALPNIEIIQPCNARETELAVNYCVKKTPANCVLRLIIGPSPRRIELPEHYVFEPGKGVVLIDGQDALLFSYGPVMLHEALIAREKLIEFGISLKVVNMPWLNTVDDNWLLDTIGGCAGLFVLEDHASAGGLGDLLLRTIADLDCKCRFACIGVTGHPAWGTPEEVLRHHGMNGYSVAERIHSKLCDWTR